MDLDLVVRLVAVLIVDGERNRRVFSAEAIRCRRAVDRCQGISVLERPLARLPGEAYIGARRIGHPAVEFDGSVLAH